MKLPRRTCISLQLLGALTLLSTEIAAQEVNTNSKTTQSPNTNNKTQQVEVTAKSETELVRKDAAAKTVVSNAELIQIRRHQYCRRDETRTGRHRRQRRHAIAGMGLVTPKCWSTASHRAASISMTFR